MILIHPGLKKLWPLEHRNSSVWELPELYIFAGISFLLSVVILSVCELNDGPIDKFYSKLPESNSIENNLSVRNIETLTYRSIDIYTLCISLPSNRN